MEFGICSYSFHRLLAAGKQDIFKYIQDCVDLGCTQLDPWSAHLLPLIPAKPTGSAVGVLSDADHKYIAKIEEAADRSGLPWGCLAVDGAHIYEASPEARSVNRQNAYRWLDIANMLGAEQVRIDAGGPEDMPDDVFAIIKDGYNDLISRAKTMGIEILFENHFGPSLIPDNCIKLCEEIEGLGLLLDTRNWKPGLREEGRKKCAKYARATHVKALRWEGDEEIGEDVEEAIQLLLDSGYKGAWGIESVPPDGGDDEITAARKTIELIRRCTGQ